MGYARKAALSTAIMLALASIGSVSPVQAQDTEPSTAAPTGQAPDQAKATKLEAITVLGSRRVSTSETDTPVPVDVIPMQKLAEQSPQFDIAQKDRKSTRLNSSH